MQKSACHDAGMMNLLTPAEIEKRAYDARLSMAEACRRAGISHSTWMRWKSGDTNPSIAIYERLVKATSMPEDTCNPKIG